MVAKRDAASKAKQSKGEAAKTNRDAFAEMAEVAGGFKLARPAIEVVRHVRSVPTCFPDFDRASRIAGWPIGNVSLVHGPSANGKTPFVLGLVRSFLSRNHFALWGDLERSTPKDWMCSLMGQDIMREDWAHPGFSAVPPEVFTYEKTRALHRDWAEKIATARAKGKLPPYTTGIFCVDSIRKLMPEGAWAELSKAFKDESEKDTKAKGRDRSGGMDGMRGAAGRMKANFNAMWMDELVPLLTSTGTSVAIIVREIEVPNAEAWEDDFRLTGGDALKFESHLWLRVTSDPVYLDGDSKAGKLVGEQHSVEIRRSKVGVRSSKRETATFHTSNGLEPGGAPKGFDLARDLMTAAIELDLVKVDGSWFKFQGESMGQGRDNATSWIRANENAVEHAVRASLGQVKAA